MSFGIAPRELMPGAKNAVEVCLGVRAGEKVVVIADEVSRGVAASLEQALEEQGARFTGLLLEDFGPRPMTAAPEPVLDALEKTDVGVLCMTPQPGELGARMEIVRVVERRQIRYAHMVGVTPEIMQQGMRADYRKVDELSERLRERMQRAETLTVKTDAGTSFSAHFDRQLDWVKTSGLISPRYWSNLPAGEVFTTPTDENSDRVGELAFGTNLGLSRMIGILLQDEKFPGVHIAFGDPYGSQTHANWKSLTHVDVLTRNCDVWIDEDRVIEKGHYQMDHLGLS